MDPARAGRAQRLLPQFRIECLLGRGGMGAVYKGWQPSLDRPVAIKLLPAEFSDDERFVARFQREARTLARLNHARIVTIHDSGQTSEGHLYFVMEYVDGTDLRRILRGPGLEPEQALAVVGQLCDALQAAHRVGIVHRDIKPENVLITSDGYVKLADFGLAQPPRDEAMPQITRTNVIMGTPSYMAPEQHVGGAQADPRSDIFALGVMFYEMLTGQRPHGVFDPPSHKVQIDVRIDDVVLRALQSEPGRRYQTVGDLKSDVEQIRSTPPPSAPPPAPPPTRFRWRPLAIGALLAVVLGAIAFLLVKGKNSPSGASGEASLANPPGETTPAVSTPVRSVSPVPVKAEEPMVGAPLVALASPRLATPRPVPAGATPAAPTPSTAVVHPELATALAFSVWSWGESWTEVRFLPEGKFVALHGPGGNWNVTGRRTVTLSRRDGTPQVEVTFDEQLSNLQGVVVGDNRHLAGKRVAAHYLAANLAPATSIFNGRDLTGWSGLKQYWSVQDGAIVGKTTKKTALKDNTCLVWLGGEVGDFEFICKFKLSAGDEQGFANSGIQFRSKFIDQSYNVMSGYQADMDIGPENYLGSLYEEKGRGVLAKLGQKITHTGPVNSTITGSLGTAATLLDGVQFSGWNEYRVVADGNHILEFINGKQTVDVLDDGAGAARKGLLGFQLHKRAPMAVQFKDLMLRRW